jgi:cyclic pyranopterin phosphate synthase
VEPRSITYLRLSITDECDMQCTYCKPQGAAILPTTSKLSIREITTLVRAFAENGITKVRLTGGEPLARPDVVKIVEVVAGTPGIETVGLTTNGVGLAELAPDLARAGLQRVNISLDSLDRDTFCRITGRDALDTVLHGLDTTLRCGFGKVKINTVVMRGVNDSEVPAIAALAHPPIPPLVRGGEGGAPVEVRFIELMPLGHSRDVWRDLHVPASEIRSMLGSPAPLPYEDGSSARLYSMPGGGVVGIISPVSEAFCGGCNRVRVTCAGKAKPCLRLPMEVDLRPLLDEPDLAEKLGRALAGWASCKLTVGSTESAVEAGAMCMVGG